MRPRHLVAAFFAIPLLYLLCCGPVMAFSQRSLRFTIEGEIVQGGELLKTVEKIYGPILALAKRSPAFAWLLGSYVRLWRVGGI